MSAWMTFAPGRERVEVAGDAVVEAGAEADDQVAALQPGHGGHGAVHAGHAEVLRVAVRERAAGHQRGDDRHPGELREHPQLAGRAGADRAAADVQHRATGLEDQPGRLADLLGVRLGHGPVAGQVQLGGPPERRHRLQRGLRDVDEDRSGAPGGGDVERLRHRARDVGGIRDEEVVLRDRHRDAADVGLLEGVGPDHRRAHLPGDRDHRHRVHVRVRDRRHEVRRAGARGGHADAHLAGGGGVPLGGVAGALLVADEDVPDRGVHEGVVRREDGAARDAEDVLRPCRLQRLDQALRPRDLGAGALLAHPLASFSGHARWPCGVLPACCAQQKTPRPKATRGDARAVVCRLSSRVACIQEGPCACPHASPSLSPASRQSVTRPRIWTRHPPAGRLGRQSRPSPVVTQALFPWASASTQKRGRAPR